MATTYEITAEMHLKKFIDETREVAQALNEFADNLEQIEKKYAEPQESEKINCKTTKCENCKNHNYCDYEPQERSDKE
jgi:hypothetical protein